MKKIWILYLFFIFSLTLYSELNFSIGNDSVKISGVPEYQLIRKTVNGKEYIKIEGKSFGCAFYKGEPFLPSISKLIALPAYGNYKISKISYETESISLDNKIIAVGWEENISLSDDVKTKDEWYKKDLVKISSPSIMRNYRFTQVTINPFSYNPAKNELKVAKNLKITLKLDSSNKENPLNTRSNLFSESFYKIAKNNILGIDNRIAGKEALNKNYLIIVKDGALDPSLEFLRENKNKLGYKVKIAYLSEIGTDAQALKEYIQNAYDNWEFPPENVLIIGDVDGIYAVPSFYVEGTLNPYNVSDLPYSLLSGDDYFPDVMLGRISVSASLDMVTIVSKLYHYEFSPPMDDGWLEKALMIASTDMINNYSTIETKKIVKNMLLSYGFNEVKTVFNTVYSANDRLEIIDAINDGVSFVNYRGGGSWNSWFGVSMFLFNIYNLDYNIHNGFKLPMVTSIVCGGGDFNVSRCLGEAFIANGTPTNPKGAIAFIGPSEYDTKTWFNNVNDIGIYTGLTNENLYTPAELMLRGKMALYNNFPYGHEYGSSFVSDQMYFYCYNLLGDPALKLWTAMPKQISSVDYQAELSDSYQSLYFKVNAPFDDNNNFTVAITDYDTLYATGITDSNGEVNIPVLLHAGNYEATFSKYGYLPYTVGFSVNSENAIKISNYNFDTILYSGTTFNLSIELKNQSQNSVDNIHLQLNDNPYLEIQQNSFDLNLNENETQSVIISGVVKDRMWNGDINSFLSLELSYNNVQDLFNLPFVLHTPLAELKNLEQIVINPNMENHFSLSVKNIGNCETGEFDCVLHSDNPNIQILQSQSHFDNISPNNIQISQDEFSVLYTGTNLYEEIPVSVTFIKNQVNMQSVEFVLHVALVDVDAPTFSDFGYVALESNDENTLPNPTYNWIEINPQIGLNGEPIIADYQDENGFIAHIELPFQVNYYGKMYDNITFSSEGWLCMGTEEIIAFRNRTIPDANGPKAMIAPFWTDISECEGYYYFDQANNRFIVEWYNANLTALPDVENNFEVILYPSEENKMSDILFQYKYIIDMDVEQNYSTIGIESPDEEHGLQMRFANIYPATVHQAENFVTTEYSILFKDIKYINVPQVEISENQYSFSIANLENPQFNLEIMNNSQTDICFHKFIYFENGRNWIISDVDTVKVIAGANREWNFTLNPAYLNLGNYNAILYLITQFGTIYPVRINLEITSFSDDSVIETISDVKVYPNPYISENSKSKNIHISFYVNRKGKFDISIYNIKGQKIRNLKNGILNAGKYDLVWNLKNDDLKEVVSGNYLIKINKDRIKKVIVIK